MREGGKRTFKKKKIDPIFEKVNEGAEINKNIAQSSRKVNEGGEKNKQKKQSWKNVFLSPEINLFF